MFPTRWEQKQPVAWARLDREWDSYFPDDRARMRRYLKASRR